MARMRIWLSVLIAASCREATAGELDPISGISPTMRTLDEIHERASESLRPWSRSLSASNGEPSGMNKGCNSDRFECLWVDGTGRFTAVLDRETGLVWQRSPANDPTSWANSYIRCHQTKSPVPGWRMAHTDELMSLLKPGGGLANADVFLNVQLGVSCYWGDAIPNGTPSWAEFTCIASATVGNDGGSSARPRWCVRGPE